MFSFAICNGDQTCIHTNAIMIALFILPLLLSLIPMHGKTVDNIPVWWEFQEASSHSEIIPEHSLQYQMACNK